MKRVNITVLPFPEQTPPASHRLLQKIINFNKNTSMYPRKFV